MGDAPATDASPSAVPATSAWSQVSVALVAGQSRLVTSRSVVPLHLLNPSTHGAACHVVLAGYGGGLVQGDSVRLGITVEAGARLCLSTQANTRVYKTPDRPATAQEIAGRVDAGALAVVVPDPLVLHADSDFRQQQRWEVAAGGRLVLVDWLASGRSESGEQFAFARYHSHVELRYAGRPVLVDDYTFTPGTHPVRTNVAFADYDQWLSIYCCGPGVEPVLAAFTELAEAWRDEGGARRRVAVSPLPGRGGLVRALARTREDLKPVLAQLHATLADPAWLGFNPLLRKY